jgi:hypothetical protein
MSERPFACVCPPSGGDAEKPFVLKRLAEAGAQTASADKPKRNSPRKSRREEL